MQTKNNTAKFSSTRPDWLYDAIMSGLAPELTTENFDEEKVREKKPGETEEDYAARMQSYPLVLDAFEKILNRIERSFVVQARAKKEEVRKKLRIQEKSERTADLDTIEHLFDDSTS